MAYMLLIHEPAGQRAARGPVEGQAVYDRMLRFSAELREQGKLLAAESLGSLATATRVQVREGKPQRLDGPFAEAKEMVGGFFLVDCATRAEAVAIAERCPAAEWCTVEVRDLAPCYVDGAPGG